MKFNALKVDLHVEDDVVHELAEAGLDGPLELGRLHQRVHKLKDGKYQILKTQHLKPKDMTGL